MSPFAISLVVICIASATLSWLITRRLIEKPGTLAHSNHRSMHKNPVPLGGGLAIMAIVIPSWIAFRLPHLSAVDWALTAGMLMLLLISWQDDRTHISPALRLPVQALAVLIVLALLPEEKSLSGNILPLWADRLIAALCWLWFINLFNFMDGIDGLAGVEIISITSGLLVIYLLTGADLSNSCTAAAIIGATIGFLWWNWHPAKIFMGDSGSITMGYLLGWLLLSLAMQGHLAAALLLPACFLADATITLIRRILTGKNILEPHKEHFYQRAALASDGNHTKVVLMFMFANALLIVLAILSVMK